MHKYGNQAVGILETESVTACFLAIDAATKAANVEVEGIGRNRFASEMCVTFRGSVSDVREAMEAAKRAAEPVSRIVAKEVISGPTEYVEDSIRAGLPG